MPAPPLESRRPAYRRIAESLRDRIVNGQYRPGARLPSTDELAVEWRSTNYTVHAALTTLVKEGWIERVNGTGTFVSERQRSFRCAGIYHGTDLWAEEKQQFPRNVHQALVRHLRGKGRTFENFTDTRVSKDSGQMLPALAEAIETRRIDCLIAVTAEPAMLRVFNRLKVPTACVATARTRHRVSFDHDELIEKAARSLAERGCRTVALITTVRPDRTRHDLGATLRHSLRRHGLMTREEWILQPAASTDDFVPYGYHQFIKLWNLPLKPDGLVVFPDLAARGVITAALTCGPAAYQGLKFVFHRNAHTQILCPFRATWLVSEEDLVAQALISLVERQFAGQPVAPVNIGYTVRHENSVLQ